MGIDVITPAYAQTAGAAAQTSGTGALLLQIVPFILIFVVFYFMMIRPQQKRLKDHQAAIDAVKRGDEIVTSGGIVGRITKVDGLYLEVEIAPNTRVRVVKSTVSQILTGAPKAVND